MSSRMTFARIVFSPPNSSAPYGAVNLDSVSAETRAIERTYVRERPSVKLCVAWRSYGKPATTAPAMRLPGPV